MFMEYNLHSKFVFCEKKTIVIDFTKVIYSMPSLKPPADTFIAQLKTCVGESAIRSPSEYPQYFEDQRDRFGGSAAAIVVPSTTEETAKVIKLCNQHNVAVVPYAGGTGLVGGQLRSEGAAGILLSVERMNKIITLDKAGGSITVGAGCILADIQNAAEDAGMLFPLSLAAEGSCRIGGNLGSNAGGLNVLRYGNARDLCLGLEVVMPDGQIWNGLKALRKDNTGYDLRHLMIGSEGTLGIITAAVLKLFPQPAEFGTAFCAIPDPANAIELLHHMRAHLGETVSALELMSERSFEFFKQHFPECQNPLEQDYAWYTLVECGGSIGEQARMMDALAEAMEQGIILDAAIASNETQRNDFWQLREKTPEANRKVGAIASHDTSVAITQIPEFIERAGAAIYDIDPELRINCFGHIGDGNLHYNVYPPAGKPKSDYLELRDQVRLRVNGIAADMNGSISAEHGIGRLKVDDLEQYGDPVKLAVMRTIKQALDPKGIMNPGAMLREIDG